MTADRTGADGRPWMDTAAMPSRARPARVWTLPIRLASASAGRGMLTVLVTRYWPRGRRRAEFDMWLRALSPAPDLLDRYRKEGLEWGEFARLYTAQMSSDATARRYIKSLHDMAAAGARLVLCCYEESGKPCHRHLLREMVATGRVVESLDCGRFEDCADGRGPHGRGGQAQVRGSAQ